MLLLLLMLAGIAGAEEPSLATPTDLSCLHEHTKTTIYFFDSPAYAAIDSETHLVSGPAVIETVCLDCGELLSSETVDYTEEIRPHSMKKGVCALCGYREKVRTAEEKAEDLPGERTLYAQTENNGEGLQGLTLTYDDLAALSNDNVITALVRGETGSAAIALDVNQTLTQAQETGAQLSISLAEREDYSFFAALYMVSDSGTRQEPDTKAITLRFYQENQATVRISLAPTDTDALVNIESEWNEHGYWSVPYLEEGTYFLQQ